MIFFFFFKQARLGDCPFLKRSGEGSFHLKDIRGLQCPPSEREKERGKEVSHFHNLMDEEEKFLFSKTPKTWSWRERVSE